MHEREQLAETAVSDLMRYLEKPSDEKFSSLTILDYFEQYVILRKKKDDPIPSAPPPGKWLDAYGNIVSQRQSSHVCRIKLQSPANGDIFYLRLILHKLAARSFLQLRTVTSPQHIPIEYPTFNDAARAQGLISGDEDYFICVEEASTFQMAHQLRGLFYFSLSF